MSSFREELLTCIEHELYRCVELLKDSELQDMASYALFPAGKRLRPMLYLLLEQALTGSEINRDSFLIANSLELLHTASLIHDDLPAIDNDDTRRGKASFHREYGDGNAVLFGDFLYAFAFDQLSEIQDSTLLVKVYPILSRASRAVQYGQLLDIRNVRGSDSVREVHELKTSSLFIACCECAAARSAKVKADSFRVFSAFGSHFGRMFQMKNDIGDKSDSRAINASKGSDVTSGRGSVEVLHEMEKKSYVLETRKGFQQALAELTALLSSSCCSPPKENQDRALMEVKKISDKIFT